MVLISTLQELPAGATDPAGLPLGDPGQPGVPHIQAGTVLYYTVLYYTVLYCTVLEYHTFKQGEPRQHQSQAKLSELSSQVSPHNSL